MAIKSVMTVAKFLEQANKALSKHTVYGSGAFGASIGDYPSQLQRYYDNTKKRCGTVYAEKVKAVASKPPCWAFDCCGLIKAIIWGWNAVQNDIYGGAEYESNGLDDIGAGKTGLISKCTDVSTDFSNIIPGEMLWLDGHVGIYIGNGEAIECTTAWTDDVQKTVVTNVRAAKSGEHGRGWTKHGKLPWVDYGVIPVPTTYNVVIGPFTTKDAATKMANAIKELGTTNVTVVVNK